MSLAFQKISIHENNVSLWKRKKETNLPWLTFETLTCQTVNYVQALLEEAHRYVFPQGEAGIRKTTTALWIHFFPSPSLLASPHPSVPCSPWTTDSMPAQKCGVTFKLCRSDSCSSVGWLHAARHVSGPPRLRWANDATPDSPLSFWACVRVWAQTWHRQ